MKISNIQLKQQLMRLAALTEYLKAACFFPTTQENQDFKDILLNASYRRYILLVREFLNYVGNKINLSNVLDEDLVTEVLSKAIELEVFPEKDFDIMFSMALLAGDLISYDYECEIDPEFFQKSVSEHREFIEKFVAQERASFS